MMIAQAMDAHRQVYSKACNSPLGIAKDFTTQSRIIEPVKGQTVPRTDRDQKVYSKACNLASGVAKDFTTQSQISDLVKEQAVPRFHREEVVLGDLLGTGGFNRVYEVHCLDLIDDEKNLFPQEMQQSRSRMSQEDTRDQYAVKFLKDESIENNPDDYCNGAADLVLESMLLSSLKPHPNIIRLHGISASGVRGFSYGIEAGYFLILDRLSETLAQRCEVWKEIEKRKGLNRCNRIFDEDRNAHMIREAMLLQRLEVAFDLCSALRHLHSCNIVFRDLKPDNVGFDMNGTVKLFDFGLAKELTPSLRNLDDTYELSGQTGSRRYMAPEVALNRPYNLSADVYSFGILLWQICSLDEPFKDMSRAQHFEHVMRRGERPELDDRAWSVLLSQILQWSWTPDPSSRPSMKAVHRALRTEIRIRKDVKSAEVKTKTSSFPRRLSLDAHLNDKEPQSNLSSASTNHFVL